MFCICLIITTVFTIEWTILNSGTTGPGSRNRPFVQHNANLIYLFGGVSSTGLTNDLWVFNLNDNTWSEILNPLGNIPPKRHDGISGFYNSNFIVSCGEGEDGVNYSDVYMFNIITNTWSLFKSSGEIPGRYGLGGGVDSSRGILYISHGFDKKERFSETYQLSLKSPGEKWSEIHENIYLYSPNGGPHARCLVSSSLMDDNFIFLAGGCANGADTGGQCPAPDAWIFNILNKEWKRIDDLPFPVINGNAIYANLMLILVGGSNQNNDQTITAPNFLNKISVYTSDKKWVNIDANLPDFKGGETGKNQLISTGTHILLVGGVGLGNTIYSISISDIRKELGTSDVSSSLYYSWVYIHGLFMFIGWGVLIQFGAFVFRYYRHTNPKGFQVHRSVNSIGLVIALLGFIFSFLTGGSFKFAHAILGIIITVFGILQPINAIFRCHPNNESILFKRGYRDRWLFNLIHHLFGRSALILSIANIIMGIGMAQIQPIWWILSFVWFGIIGLCYLIAEILARKYPKELWYWPSLKVVNEDESYFQKLKRNSIRVEHNGE